MVIILHHRRIQLHNSLMSSSSLLCQTVLLAATLAAFAAAQTYQFKRDAKTGRALTPPEEQKVECWHFTWVGPVEDDTNTSSINCDTYNIGGIPCFEPLVWTTGDGRFDGPNYTQIEQQCRDQETINGQSCNPYCTKQEHSCVKMTYYLRDAGSTIAWESHFCGDGIDLSDDGAPINDDCQTDNHHGQYDIEACFCQGHKCNSADRHPSSSISHLALVSLLSLYLPIVRCPA